MCYLSAGSSGDRGVQALRMGILVLAVPALLSFAGLFFLAYRRREPAEWHEDPDAAVQLEQSYGPLPAERQNPSPSAY
jgi:hypothetical protein